ncbi:hypothetical protein [Nostoc sp. 'Lobaria pulmonaria (5183) cyanobiont']|uniref:hypothetical protein n=1 Tax=Nostoc sp. 'Lobaria pulmonaria (5183) cyanobiont' TaxID=1618022 RepID=UPI00131A417E|nr:hypothetical protein [Nostoc sp. 'Lobaria pulmonaria (5183) cyanobiont']
MKTANFDWESYPRENNRKTQSMIEQELEQENLVKQQRFCSWCGLSLVPLSSNVSCYVSRSCTECGKTIYTPPTPAENGQGLVVNAGESLHVLMEPFSLSPRRRGFFTRNGLLLTVRMLLAAVEPKSEAELETLLKFYKDKAELFLKNSPLLDGVDWDNENHADEICTRLTQDKDRREFFAFKMFVLSQIADQAIIENNVRQTAWAMYHITMAHCFFEMGDFDFEETLWLGHQAHVFLAKVQDASVQTPAQAQAIEKLQPLFERQTEVTLHTWVEDEKPIGERIGIYGLPEETLRAMAKYHLNQFERKRQEALQAKEDKRKEEEARRQERIVWNPVLIACISLATAILVSLVNKFIPPH